MKKITLFSAIALLSNLINAQAFEKGTNILSAGIGLGGNMGLNYYSAQTPALSLQYEKGIWETAGPGVISMGGYLGHKSYRNMRDYRTYSVSERWAYTIIGVRSAYHFTGLDNDKLDLYAGAMLSFNKLSYNYDATYKNGAHNYYDNYNISGNYASRVGLSYYAGARYFPKEHIGFFAEAGYGISYLTLGTTFKF